MGKFQTVVLGIFIFGIVLGVLAFSGVLPTRKSSQSVARGTVTLWGTIPNETLASVLSRINTENSDFSVQYVEKNAATFDTELIEALARDQGPDLVLIAHDGVVRHQDKLFAIPYESFTERAFKDMYIQEGELYLAKEGILALPLSVDPLVMYYNRPLFDGAGVALPPAYWDEFFALAPKLTIRGPLLSISQSFVALGESSNVTHAKEILSALMLQLGNGIVSRDMLRDDDGLKSTLGDGFGFEKSPAVAALEFYTEFSNPVKSSYSWNRGLPPSREAFAAGDVAVYIGYASELFAIRDQNPNLDFDVAKLPQPRDAVTPKTFGRMNGIGIMKSSTNFTTAYTVAYLLSAGRYAEDFATALSLPPARRDLLAKGAPTSAYGKTFYDSALISRGWLEPNRAETTRIFNEMIDNTTSGRLSASEAVSRAAGALQILLR